MAKPHKLTVPCDDTWCGRETGTKSNIHMLAKMIGIDVDNGAFVLDKPIRRLKARYFLGAGQRSTFLDHLFNGATGPDIERECTEIYRYIVENYTNDHEIWMSGSSRGSCTIRCIAGMINNCGMITRMEKGTDMLCKEMYKIYRSPYVEDVPHSAEMEQFRKHCSWIVTTPIKFMGILDTVGSLEIPVRMQSGLKGLTFMIRSYPAR